ncbi:MAG TPA: ABC transporter permease [Puia sp.]|nr:ABC transporter permease [Puia sp.]
MFKNNIRIAWRSLKKDLSFSITNLAGLAIGITCCLLILSFVLYELSFDGFHSKKDRIYRVNYDVLMGGNQVISPSVPVFVAPELKKKFPEIEEACRFSTIWSPPTVSRGNVVFDEKKFCYADPAFFKIFDFKSVSGDVETALSNPNMLVITEDMAKKYFGTADPIGQPLLLNNKKQYVVKAVVENVPSNSHLSFDFITSFQNIEGFRDMEANVEWNNPNYTTFLLLKPVINTGMLSAKIDTWVNPPHKPGEQVSENTLHLRLEQLKRVHFNTQAYNYANQLSITDSKYIGIFITIAILVLLIACGNYVNLATAKASIRAREVAVRKTIGANFRQLFTQFISESFLLVLPAVLISIAAVGILLPYLNRLLGKEIPFRLLDSNYLFGITGGWILLSMLSGFYPAIVLSRFKPVETLKGSFEKTGKSGLTIRKSLVVFQFTISMILILATMIVGLQLKFMQSEKLGFDQEHVLLINGNSDIDKKLDAFSGELKKISGVQDVSLTWRSPFGTVVGNGFSIKSNPGSEDDWHIVGGIAADQHYIPTLGISLLKGRNFDPAKIKKDSTVNEFIVNEAFLRHYNLKSDSAVGRKVILGLTGPGNIVGVMKDFHISSMHDKIEPVVLFNNPKYFGSILLRIAPGQIPNILAQIENRWRAFVPARPFSYSFLDDEYDAMYRTERKLGSLMSILCGMAIFITCLGLLGLVAFIITHRTKEIGIRRILGASVSHITALVSKDFLGLIIIAVIIASPVAYYFMHQWLQDYSYRISISWWMFGLASFVVILLALITISYHTIRAAKANPVKSLRND